MIELKAANGQVYHLSPSTNLADFVLWAATEGYRVKWTRK
jgi:hypothetical protein